MDAADRVERWLSDKEEVGCERIITGRQGPGLVLADLREVLNENAELRAEIAALCETRQKQQER